MDKQPEFITFIINKNNITEEMIDQEEQQLRQIPESELYILTDNFLHAKEQWLNLITFVNKFPQVYLKEVGALSNICEGVLWAINQTLEMIDQKDYRRIAALKLLVSEIDKYLHTLDIVYNMLIFDNDSNL